MKKKLALLLCVLMAVMPIMAMAEGEGAYLRISNPQIYEGDELLLDLTGLGVEFGAGMNEVGLATWAKAIAGNAELLGALEFDGETLAAYASIFKNVYALNLPEVMDMLGLTEDVLAELLGSVEVPDFEPYIAEFEEALDAIGPYLSEAEANAVYEEGVTWTMYDTDHSCMMMSMTIPTEAIRIFFEAAYDLTFNIANELNTMAGDMEGLTDMLGMDLDFEATANEIDMDELFETNPTILVDVYVAEDSEEYVSLAFYLMDDTMDVDDMIPIYLDLYMPEDGLSAYVFFPADSYTHIEVLFDAYDDGYTYFRFAVSDPESSEILFDTSYTCGYDSDDGTFLVQEFLLKAEGLDLSVYDHNDYATEHYFEVVANADGTEVLFELVTAPNGSGADGYIALAADEAVIFADIEYGMTNDILSLDGVGLKEINILTMGDEEINQLGADLEEGLMNFLMNAVEEVPALEMLFGE